VSHQERFSLTRRNCGFPHSVTVLVTYPSLADLPAEAFLATRVAELQEHFPLLYARLVDAKTRSPYFAPRSRPWTSAEIVRHETFDAHPERTQEQERILFVENDRMSDYDIEDAPMWRVAILASAGSARVHLAVSAHHEIVDGMGILTLTRALLAPSITHLPHEALGKIPALEDTIRMKPTLAHVLPLMWRDLALPHFPKGLQSILCPPQPWPAREKFKPPMECPWDVSLLALSPSLIPALKAAGVAHGVPALHMTLQMAYALAIRHVCGGARPRFTLSTATPKSERRVELGHAYCTGNYCSDFVTDLDLRPTDHFWAVTAKLSAFFRSPAGLSAARQHMGALRYIPDPKPNEKMRDTTMPTGWEAYMLGKGYETGLNMSNLGAIALPPGSEDVVWAQGGSPFIGPFSVNIIGHEGGLRASTVWREGAPVSRAEVKRIERVFEAVLGRLGDEKWEGLTLEALSSGL
jgi:hypothetical protein